MLSKNPTDEGIVITDLLKKEAEFFIFIFYS